MPYFAYRLGSVNTYGHQPDLLEMVRQWRVTRANLFVGFNFKNWTVLQCGQKYVVIDNIYGKLKYIS